MVKKFKKPVEDDFGVDLEAIMDIQIGDIELPNISDDIEDVEDDSPTQPIAEQLEEETRSLNSIIKKIKESDNQHDPEFFFCVYFKTQEQKMQFLKETGIIKFGENHIDGRLLSKLFDVSLADTKLVTPVHKTDKKLSEFLT